MLNNYSTNGHDNQALADAADQLYAELQVVTRRLRRIQVLVNGVVVLEDAEMLWSRAGEICGQALATVENAVLAIPEIPGPREVPQVLVVGPLQLDTIALRASFGERELILSRQEFRLLETLSSTPTSVWSKAELLKTVWGYDSTPTTRTVDTHASRLRRKLIAAGAPGGQWVINVWGVGYALCRP